MDSILLPAVRSCVLAALAASTPDLACAQRPEPPTEAACLAYHRAVFAESQQLHREISRCMSETEPLIGIGPECSIVSNRVVIGTQAWPQCTHAEQMCEVKARLDDSYDCMKQAARNTAEKRKAAETLALLEKAEKDFKRLRELAERGLSGLNDPEQFFKDRLGNYVEERLLDRLGMRDDQGHFTQRGITAMQETYDFLFARREGRPMAYADNPIIKLIQENAADRLHEVHSQVIHDFEASLIAMEDIAAELPGSSPAGFTVGHSPAAPSGASGRRVSAKRALPEECTILTSARRTQFANDEPERFQALIARCK